MMWTAEDCHQLAPEQYGSQKHHWAIDQGCNKCLSIDLLLSMIRWPGVICSNDAKSCYNRIVHAVGSLSMLWQWVPKAAIICVFSTLQKLTHTIRTAYGDSKGTYGGSFWVLPVQDEIGPMHGIMQGNGKGPALWAVVSSLALDMLWSQGLGSVFKMAISGNTIHFVGFSFVDDTNQIELAWKAKETPEEVVTKMQAGLDAWEGGIHATRGALVPMKSHCWDLINFFWENAEWRLTTKADDTSLNLTVQDHNGVHQMLERLNPAKAKATLGVWQAPSGDATNQIHEMRKLTEECADQLCTGKLKQHKAWLALTTTVWKTLEYPLNALTLSKQECEFIMAPAMQAGLNGCGICRNLPYALRHGPSKDQGLRVPHIYTLQGIARIMDLLNHNHSPNTTGFLHRANLDQLIIELGLGADALIYSHKCFGKLGTFWCLVERTWQFLSDYKLLLNHDIKVPFQREGDRFIMAIMSDNNTSINDLLAINRCRVHLQVTTISGVTSGNGLCISSSSIKGDHDSEWLHCYQWPYQPKPTPQCWSIWRKALRWYVHDAWNKLNQPLGNWINEDKEWLCQLPDADAYLFRGYVEKILRRKIPQLRDCGSNKSKISNTAAYKLHGHPREFYSYDGSKDNHGCWQNTMHKTRQPKNKHTGKTTTLHTTHSHGTNKNMLSGQSKLDAQLH
jgi:hypothetical protein